MKRGELEQRYGCIKKATVVGCVSLVYTIELETDKGTFTMVTGGNTEEFECFQYDPTTTNWKHHIFVGIQSIEVKKTMKSLYSCNYSYDDPISSSVKTSLKRP